MMTRYSKHLLLLLFSCCSFLSCFSQNVTLASQADVDAFDSATTTITGNLRIQTTSTSNPITDLSNLLNLTAIGGYLTIRNNAALINLDGLANLSSITGYLLIFNNDALTNLDGLANISAIGENLTIRDNATLTNLDGIVNLSTVGGSLIISTNDALINLDGLTNLSTIGGNLSISGNDVLTNLDGLANLSAVGGNLVIDYHAALTNLDGLANLSSIGGSLIISTNDALINLDGLANLSSIGENLDIDNNQALTNLDGLANLSTIGGNLRIYNNQALTNLDGLANLSAIGESLSIYYNSVLTNCCAIQILLSAPNAIGGAINITNNPSECSSAEEIIAAPCTIQIAINVPCIGANNGSIQVEITVGIAPLTYTWERLEDGQTENGISSDPNFIIENLGAGTYNLTVIDAVGTEFIQENIVLIPVPGSVFEIIELTTTNSSNGTSNGAIHLSVAGGTPPYDLTWSGSGAGTQMDLTELPLTIPSLSQGEYEITVADATGNQQTISITLLDETVPVFPCTQPLDIVILNDVSGSVDAVE